MRRLGSILALCSSILWACAPEGSASCPEPAAPPSAQAPAEDGSTAQGPAQDPEALTAVFDALGKRAQELYDVPGMAVGVVQGQELIFAAGYGELERGTGAPVDAKTSFAIASNTKAFTATAVGLLVESGALGWDDRVVEHLPELELWDPYVTRELRVRDLLSHRVGLDTWAGDMLWIASNYDRDTVMSRLRHLPARHGFRERYGYSNLMYMVAGALIEAKSGRPWDDYLREKLLVPLGMDDVATRVGQLEGRTNVARPHIKVEGRWRTTDYLDLAAVGPAASFHANIEDLSRWVAMQLADGRLGEREVVSKAVIRETRQPHMWLRVGDPDFFEPARHFSGYGLGWYVADYRGELMVTHSGGMPGMTSRVLMFPEADVGVIVLTSSESAVSLALSLQLADLLLAPGETRRKDYLAALSPASDTGDGEGAVEVEAPSGSPPSGLEGKWRNPILGAGVVRREGDATWFEVPDHGGLRCRLFGPRDASTSDTRPARVPCAWEDPNMGVSEFRLEYRGKRVRAMHFQIRPDFYDPLEYHYER